MLPGRFTPREIEVLSLQRTPKETAELLHLSVRTVESHRYGAERKLRRMAEMIRKAGGLRDEDGNSSVG